MKENNIIKISKIALSTIFYLIIAVLLLFSVATLSKKRDNQIPNIFGFGFLAVHEEADSMIGDNKDSFNPGDLVFIKVLKESKRKELDLSKLKDEGVVVSFYDHNIKQINTHRVVEYNADTNTIRTQGDNESEMDSFYLHDSDIIGIYSGKLKGFGKPIAFMQKPLGFALVVILPMFGLLVFQGYSLFKNLYAVKEDKLKETMELERELMKQELLKELSKEKEEGEE